MKILFVSAIAAALFISSVSFAQEPSLEEENKYYFTQPLDLVTSFTKPIKRHLRDNKIDLDFFAGVFQGYDNNVNLDPSRKKDGFLQTSLNTAVTYNYTDDIRLKVDNDSVYILYYKVSDADLFDSYTSAGVELDTFDDLFTVGADYSFEAVFFPRDDDSTYLANGLDAFVKQNINNYLSHKASYKLLFKNFTHGKALNTSGATTDDLRKDMRNGFEYEISANAFERAIFKFKAHVYYNDSNDQYYNYYDYWSYKLKPSLIVMFTKKFYTIANFIYEQRRYEDRLSTKNSEHEQDDTYTINTSLLYDLTPSFTVALNYSYIENTSNEPLQKYSGSTVTAGIYYAF